MQRQALMGQILGAVVPRSGVGDVSSSGAGGLGGWIVTLTSLVAVLAVGGVAARVVSRLLRRSTPDLVVLLNQSAEFYSRWPEDRLDSAPRSEVMIEAARCRRIIELLESRGVAADDPGPAPRGPIDGLRAWVAVLHKRIDDRVNTPAGSAYA